MYHKSEESITVFLFVSFLSQHGSMPHSYRLVSVVNHIGTSSSAGHYVSDVYDAKKDAWFSYDDSDVQKIREELVREERRRSGYIFFYAVNYE